MLSLAFTADSRQTEAGRLYNRSEEDETRTPLQKAIDDADYEHGHRVNELDFLTAFRSPVMVARKSNCAFNTVRLSSTGRGRGSWTTTRVAVTTSTRSRTRSSRRS
jgi:hypothetical protein